MFGIEKLREDILELRDAVDHFKGEFIEYTDGEVKFDEVRSLLKGMFDDYIDDFEERLKVFFKDLSTIKKPATKRITKKKHP